MTRRDEVRNPVPRSLAHPRTLAVPHRTASAGCALNRAESET
jgi:hypothetical protein